MKLLKIIAKLQNNSRIILINSLKDKKLRTNDVLDKKNRLNVKFIKYQVIKSMKLFSYN